MPQLEIKAYGQTKALPLTGGSVRIGRQSDNDIVLTDPAASRQHCVIEKTDGGFRLRDLSSHNGTWIGDNRVSEIPLRVGDQFRIGQTWLRLLPDIIQRADPEAPQYELTSVEPVVEVEEEKPPVIGTRPPPVAVAKLGLAAAVSGALAKQLRPLIEAVEGVPIPEGAPQAPRELRLLNKKGATIDAAQSKAAEAVEALRQLLFVSFRVRATDIHIEPKGEIFTIRMRIDGLLHPVGDVTLKMGLAILNVIKVLCEADIAKRNVVQEGSFAAELPNRRVDFRVSLTPTVHGQKLALRFLDKGAVPSQFENLGMDFETVSQIQRICEQDAGMIILAGPTGSGKTTTLYTALHHIDAKSRNIVTIEDPVEYELANTTQISIDPLHNLTFASVLGSVLRQDPDVILVGEIRDNETAKMAMQAATTGHLVLTTIHARDTIGTVFRLLDLGVEPFLVANAITMCISQRLVRTLCPACKRAYKPDSKLIRRLGLENRPHGDFYEAVGCKKCMNVGYRGRIALYETLVFNQQIRDVILTEPTITEIRKAAGEWMFQTLATSGFSKVIEGVTTVEEVDRVSGMV